MPVQTICRNHIWVIRIDSLRRRKDKDACNDEENNCTDCDEKYFHTFNDLMSADSHTSGFVTRFARRYVEYPRSKTPMMPNSLPRRGNRARTPIPPTVPTIDVRISEPHAAQPKPSAPVK